MEAILAFAGITSPSERWHMLGTFRTEDDRPKQPATKEREWFSHLSAPSALGLTLPAVLPPADY
jgi:hypothetical protein